MDSTSDVDDGAKNVTQSMPVLDDRPWAPGDVDRLQFRPLARQIAKVIGDRSLRTGFVIGLDGPWGSGKSSLCAQVIEELGVGIAAPRVVQFNPWLIGERDALISELFGGIAAAVEAMAMPGKPGATGLPAQAARATAGLVRRYAKHLGAAGKLVSAAKLLIPFAGEAAAGVLQALLEGASAIGDVAEPDKPLPEQKAELEEALKGLPRRIVIVVDDAERLEPNETLEMLRLVKAVGGLPNVVYLVAFDRAALVRNIDRALGTKGVGSDYLEKIIQATVSVPEPEDRVLRAWFIEELVQLVGLTDDQRESAEGRRLLGVIDSEGGRRLNTPRDVVRCINSLRLVWPAVRSHVDLGDLVWLHLLKLKAPDLYKWIEGYLVQLAEVATTTAFVEDSTPAVVKLKRLLKRDRENLDMAFIKFGQIIPGIGRADGVPAEGKEKWQLFKFGEGTFDKFTAERRLGSPHYFRYYFSLGQHGGLLPSEMLDEFRRLLSESPQQFSSAMAKLAGELMPNGQLRLAPLLDYLTSILDRLEQTERDTIVQSLAVCMETAIAREPFGFGRGRCWAVGEMLLFRALRGMSPADRDASFLRMVERGESLTWVAKAIRVARPDADRDIEVSNAAFEEASRTFEARVLSAGQRVVMAAVPDLVLNTWMKLTRDTKAFAKHVSKLTSGDVAFIRVLHSCRGWVSSDRVYRPLKEGDVKALFDFDEARKRAESIDRQRLVPPIQKLLDEVLEGFREGDELRR